MSVSSLNILHTDYFLITYEKNYNKKKYPISIACGVTWIPVHPQLLSFSWVFQPLAVTVEGGTDGGDGAIHIVYC